MYCHVAFITFDCYLIHFNFKGNNNSSQSFSNFLGEQLIVSCHVVLIRLIILLTYKQKKTHPTGNNNSAIFWGEQLIVCCQREQLHLFAQLSSLQDLSHRSFCLKHGHKGKGGEWGR